MSVAVVMGSKSDLDIVQGTFDVLEQFDIPFEARVLSAHRTPDEAAEYAADKDKLARVRASAIDTAGKM